MVFRHPPFWKFDTVDLTSPWFMQSCMKCHNWKFVKIGITVHDNIFKVLITGWLSYICIHGSGARCSTCIAEQITSKKLLTWCFLGRPLACHFANTSIHGNGQICPFSFKFHDFSMTFDDFSKFHDSPWLFQKILFFQVFQVFPTLWEPWLGDATTPTLSFFYIFGSVSNFD